MPYRTIQVKAPLFMRHKGTKVHHVFKNDDADAGDLRTYAYTFDPIEGGDDQNDGVVNFDVRDLSTFDKNGPQDEKSIKKAIRAALDEGEVGPKKTVECSLCGKPCSAMKARLHQGKWVGDECCWDDRLKASE